MAKTVWKYELTTNDVNELEIPIGGKILTLQMQNGIPCIWALVDHKAEKETRRFGTIGTGNFTRQENIEYIGTFQTYQGALVWHVFEFFLKDKNKQISNP
jgi:hypothetical protein